ncbi:MAG: hypothetical protein L3K16_05350 [Thermoplasmata archaeon]|nr:hypothetical protein [Thermoplasmata archaeon]
MRLDTPESASKPGVISRILLLGGVVMVVDFRGPATFVRLHYSSSDELQRKVELMSTIAHSPQPSVWPEIPPPADIAMRAVDWRVVGGLMEDAQRDLGELAVEIGVSRRSVERRLEAMSNARAIYLVGQPDVAAVAGVVCDLILSYSSVAEKERGDRWLVSEIPRVAYLNSELERRTIVTFLRENLAEAERVLQNVRAGVEAESVGMESIRQLTVSTRWQAERVRTLGRPA